MHTPTTHPQNAAFTLVEMAIVMVIVGLLVGAVLGGKSLLKQSEMQTVVADYSKYMNATNQFRQQFGGWPGDLLDATSFWGDDSTTCSDGAVTDGTPGSCNGNNDGQILGVASYLDEPYRAWQQLVLAKYMEGSFTGIRQTSGPTALPGTNVPKSRIANGGWSFSYKAAGSTADLYTLGLDNYLSLGAPVASNITRDPLLKPTEAWNIDKKIDDGFPGKGRVLSYKPTPGTINPNCTDSPTDASAKYDLSYNDTACSLQMSLTTK